MRKLALIFATLSVLGGCGYNRKPQIPAGVQFLTMALTALQNRPVMLAFATNINPDCSSRGISTYQSIEEPLHGSVKISKTQDYPNYPTYDPRGECSKRKVEGLKITYVPGPDFVGEDTLVGDLISPDGSVRRLRYKLTVR